MPTLEQEIMQKLLRQIEEDLYKPGICYGCRSPHNIHSYDCRVMFWVCYSCKGQQEHLPGCLTLIPSPACCSCCDCQCECHDDEEYD